MRGQADLFGEIHEDEEDEIIKIAWEAVKNQGYAVYSDFNEFMRRKMGEPQPAPADISHAQRRIEVAIKEILEASGWTASKGHPKTRFYPPGTELPNLGRRLI